MPQVVKSKIRTVPNWPKDGIMFRDITTLLKDGPGFNHLIDLLVQRYESTKLRAKTDLLPSVDARAS